MPVTPDMLNRVETMLEALENAEAGSRELDLMVAELITDKKYQSVNSRQEPHLALRQREKRTGFAGVIDKLSGPKFSDSITVPEYTTDFNAAMRLCDCDEFTLKFDGKNTTVSVKRSGMNFESRRIGEKQSAIALMICIFSSLKCVGNAKLAPDTTVGQDT